MPRRLFLLIGLIRARVQLGLRRARGERIRCGRRPIFWRGALKLDVRGEISIGDDLKAYAAPIPARISAGPEGVIVLGDGVFINYGVEIYAARSVTIGDNVHLADMAAIYDTDFHQLEENAAVRVEPVRIGSNAWIGRQAIILPGVTIGDHAVVAAGSIVTKDVPAKTLVAGNPASVRRELSASENWTRT
jgi:acetyltransferase-like isoleucine patch superfamily enzyme